MRDEEFVDRLRGWWWEFSQDNEPHKQDPSLFWDTAKAVLMGLIIAYSAEKKKDVNSKNEEAVKV